jgi:hypothetical protein
VGWNGTRITTEVPSRFGSRLDRRPAEHHDLQFTECEERNMGLPGMVLSAISMVAGAVMYWAVAASTSSAALSHGFRLSTIGVILMIAGAVGFCASAIVFAVSRRTPSPRLYSTDRVTVGPSGTTTEVHEKRS